MKGKHGFWGQKNKIRNMLKVCNFYKLLKAVLEEIALNMKIFTMNIVVLYTILDYYCVQVNIDNDGAIIGEL